MRLNDNLVNHARLLLCLTVVSLLVAPDFGYCVDEQAARKVQLQPRQIWNFGDVHFNNEFSGARLNGCEQISENEFKVIISPENEPINKSPWYAFKVWSETKRKISVRFLYTYGSHRTRPWVSHDGEKWERLAERDHVVNRDLGEGTAKFAIGPKPLWIAAQELIGLKQLGDWTDAKCALPFVQSSIIGQSIEGRPLRQFVLSETTNANYVFVIGRQHPPEVTGTIGMMSFVDVIAGNSKLAKKFRSQFQTVVIPLVNPDGVEHGHWRSNLGGVDLNRDWKPFSQPESRATSNAIRTIARQPDARPFVFLDFHSTHTNIYYAQPDEQKIFPNEFTRRWLEAVHTKLPRFGFDRDNGHNLGQFTSKAWANETFGIAAITWEFGYNTDRKTIRQAATVGAEELMRLLLEEASNSKSASTKQAGRPEIDGLRNPQNEVTLGSFRTNPELCCYHEVQAVRPWGHRIGHFHFAPDHPGQRCLQSHPRSGHTTVCH